jgi:hypothetical protein
LNLAEYKDRLGFVKYYGLVIAVLGLTFYLGYAAATWYDSGLRKEVQMSRQSQANLSIKNQELQSKINTLQIEVDLANLVNQQHLKTLQEAHATETALKEQLGFYQRVMAPELTQDGFVVERVEVAATASANNYRLSLILLQHENIKESVEGELDISIEGSLDNKPKSYKIKDLLDEAEHELNYNFKYFQVLTSNITLPDNFIPQTFEISTDVYKYKRRQGRYNTTINWSDAYSE